MTKQCGLRVDAAHTPAQHAKRVDHRGVRVAPDHELGVCPEAIGPLARLDHARDFLQIDLMDDAAAWRMNRHAAKRLLRPLQELVALGVALVFPRQIPRLGIRGSGKVDL